MENITLFQKIHQVQTEIGTISKESTNPFFKSKYFDINTLIANLKPLLEKHSLMVLQPLSNIDGKPALTTMVIDPESGETIQMDTPLPETSKPQDGGSAITYYRRYALQSLFLLEAQDDDGNKASGKSKVDF